VSKNNTGSLPLRGILPVMISLQDHSSQNFSCLRCLLLASQQCVNSNLGCL